MSGQAKKRVIVTGGAGYIGSHICVELIHAGYKVLVIDDLSNSHPVALERIEAISGDSVEFLKADLSDHAQSIRIENAVSKFRPSGAIHLAGLKAVGESSADPLLYYNVNLNSMLVLAKAMNAANAKSIVFSSSATVYGDLNQTPVDETGLTQPSNPYGRTKYFIEEMLRDLHNSSPSWRICNLRYFNPVGAHPSGRIGEDPNGVPNNLFPFIAQVAVGARKKLSVFGGDYPTRDGTGVRDYIHVCDLAQGHLRALEYLERDKSAGVTDINLGTGVGYSVLEAIAAFKRASNRDIPYEIVARRDGDIAEIFAKPDKAKNLLGWQAEKNLDQMCADHWRWQSENPNGYED